MKAAYQSSEQFQYQRWWRQFVQWSEIPFFFVPAKSVSGLFIFIVQLSVGHVTSHFATAAHSCMEWNSQGCDTYLHRVG
jgi:hypothetical protein